MGTEPVGLPPDKGDPGDRIVRVLVAIASVVEFVAQTSNNPTVVMTAGLLAWTLRVLFSDR